MTLREQIEQDCESVIFDVDGLAETVTLVTQGFPDINVRAIFIDPEDSRPMEIGAGGVADRTIYAMIPDADLPTTVPANSTVKRFNETWKILRKDRQTEWIWKFTLYIDRSEKRIPGKAVLR